MVQPVAQADSVEEVNGALADVWLAAQFERYHGVFEGAEGGDELEGLEDEADLFAAEVRALVFVETV